MLTAFLLSLREGLEIALVIGVVLSALRKVGRPELNRLVWAGAISAGLISLLAAILLQGLGASLESPYEEIFEGSMMILAAGVLTWMIFWMRRQGQGMKLKLESEVQQAVLQPGKAALFTLAFVAVLREGIELALFVSAAAITASQGGALIGALLGIAAAALIGWALFAAILRLNLHTFFQVTSILLILFAAGLLAHGVHEFNEVGLIPPVIEHVWDISSILPDDSPLGITLGALLGYNANPSLIEVLVYGAYIIFVVAGLRAGSHFRKAQELPGT